MAETETASQVSKLSIWLSVGFALVGVGLLYLAIAIADASIGMKILWASGLSLAVAFTFAIVWTMARDAMKTLDEERRRSRSA